MENFRAAPAFHAKQQSCSNCPGVLTKCCSGDQIRKNEMGGACGTNEEKGKCIQSFGGDTWGKETAWKR
jgi:hypothetical protein